MVTLRKLGYVLQALRDKLRCKEIWVVGANRYRNPDDDLRAGFEDQRETYYAALRQPRAAAAFTAGLHEMMTTALAALEQGLPKNPAVEVLSKGGGWIKLSPLEPQLEPPNLARLKAELGLRWPMTTLLDILKETDLRVGFTEQFKSGASRETLDRTTLQRRLLSSPLPVRPWHQHRPQADQGRRARRELPRPALRAATLSAQGASAERHRAGGQRHL